MTGREMLGYGLLAGLLLAFAIWFWMDRKRRRKEWVRNHGPRKD